MGFGFVGDALGAAKDKAGDIADGAKEVLHTAAYIGSEAAFATSNLSAHYVNQAFGQELLPEIHLIGESETIKRVESAIEPVTNVIKTVDALEGVFLNSALHAAVQSPIDGLSQLTNEIVGHDVIPHLELIAAPKPAEFGTPEFFAQQLGFGVGTILPFFIPGAGAAGVVGKIGEVSGLARAASEGSLAARIALPVLRSSAAGAAFSLTQPVDPNGDFWQQKFQHAAFSAVTFGAQGGAAASLRSTVPLLANNFVGRLAIETASGITAGIVNAELENGFDADRTELFQSAVTNAFIGNALHTLSGEVPAKLVERTSSTEPTIQQQRAPRPLPENDPFVQKQVGRVGTSDAFQARINQEVAQLPYFVKELLEAQGIQIIGFDRTSTLDPVLANTPGRGYSHGLTYAASEGFYDPARKYVALIENVFDQYGNALPPRPIELVIRHEVGHALDQALGYSSRDAEFRKAWLQDINNLSPQERQQFQYFVQGFQENGPLLNNNGLEETFGEAFKVLTSLDKRNNPETRPFYQAFPNSFFALKTRLALEVLNIRLQQASV